MEPISVYLNLPDLNKLVLQNYISYYPIRVFMKPISTEYDNFLTLRYEPLYACTNPKNLSIRYDSFKSYCFVIKLDPLSFSNDSIHTSLAVPCYAKIFESFVHLYKIVYKRTGDLLGIVEETKKGTHLHLLLFTLSPLTKDILIDLETELLTADLYLELSEDSYNTCILINKNAPKLNWKKDNPFSSHAIGSVITYKTNIQLIVKTETIRNTSAYTHYMRKNPQFVFHSDLDIGIYFVHYERTHIFREQSVPKFYHYNDTGHAVRTQNSLVILLFALFNKGILDYDDVLKYPEIQNYLHYPNLKSIYDNCIQQFTSSHTHVKNLISIIQRFRDIDINSRCFCPLLEWLHFQQIDEFDFFTAILRWLNANIKKNTLLFYGPPNSGKSHVARLIWQQFLFHKRIVQDGIFTFANLLNCGCALWDEPLIAPDLADTTKLVLEGLPNINISIKNKATGKLNKRVPILITSNQPIHRYCSGERSAFEERCFTFTTTKKYDVDFCTISTDHMCTFLDTPHCTYNTPSSIERYHAKRRRKTATSEKACTGFHVLKDQHIICYLAFVLIKAYNRLELDLWENDAEEEDTQTQLLNLLSLLENDLKTFCYYSYNESIAERDFDEKNVDRIIDRHLEANQSPLPSRTTLRHSDDEFEVPLPTDEVVVRDSPASPSTDIEDA